MLLIFELKQDIVQEKGMAVKDLVVHKRTVAVGLSDQKHDLELMIGAEFSAEKGLFDHGLKEAGIATKAILTLCICEAIEKSFDELK